MYINKIIAKKLSHQYQNKYILIYIKPKVKQKGNYIYNENQYILCRFCRLFHNKYIVHICFYMYMNRK